MMDSIGTVYNIPCAQCPKAYVGETGRKLGVRIEEHKDSVKKVDNKAYTRSQRKQSENKKEKSAMADHLSQDNHLIAWDNVKIVAREQERFPRWICESLHIRKQGEDALNRARDKTNYRTHGITHCAVKCVKPIINNIISLKMPAE